MSRIKQLIIYRKHLEDRYLRLLEKSNEYRFIDESKSDTAAFKAMKILDKINRVSYLDREILNTVS
ncbi:hypothetical protein H9W90_00890 [Polaribacter pectinis]|uniref:Lacal_2735 family protein n=1 Tax=Polaribacter pectinis TaxID=2738844 RepID=A0A7G9LAR3_9FLAO|nr:hypothetical protein [Polaribacter pectinis]QNM85712.1 hypothetical protein H9W90_00890 [Polaribacter pectinis]